MSVSFEIIEVIGGVKPNLPSITIEFTLPLYIWNELGNGYVLASESILDKIIDRKVIPEDFSGNSAALLYTQFNAIIKSLVQFYHTVELIPIDTLLSAVPLGYLQTRTMMYSIFDLYLIIGKLRNSIFPEAILLAEDLTKTDVIKDLLSTIHC